MAPISCAGARRPPQEPFLPNPVIGQILFAIWNQIQIFLSGNTVQRLLLFPPRFPLSGRRRRRQRTDIHQQEEFWNQYIHILEHGSTSGERFNPVVTFCLRHNNACQAEIARYFGTRIYRLLPICFEFLVLFMPVGTEATVTVAICPS